MTFCSSTSVSTTETVYFMITGAATVLLNTLVAYIALVYVNFSAKPNQVLHVVTNATFGCSS